MSDSDLLNRDGELINNWYIACLSHELGKSPLECTIYDTKLVLFRDEKNIPFCFINKCLHRHAELSAGEVQNGHLLCPYHGWSYNTEGVVTSIPSEGPEMIKGRRCQKSFPVIERDGVIWIWMGNTAE